MIHVRFVTLAGKFETAREQDFDKWSDVTAAVEAYAKEGGFSGVKLIDGEDDGARFTAKTPGGRGGRNIAFVDYY